MQIVGYRSDDPTLLVAESGAVRTQSLARRTELAYTLSERHCAGAIEGEHHHACERQRAPYCEIHTTSWAVANNRDSDEEHAIYLAAFAPRTFKVGVTRLERLERRLREQGADRAAHVRTVPDGRIARERETAIATASGITERVRVATKIRGFGKQVDDDSWEGLLAEFDVCEQFAFGYGLALDGRPVAETLLSGVVRGVKGRVLVLDHRNTTYAVDMRDLVGYDLHEGTTDRELQASLDGFS